jgi:membrane associated rhomboid family serine protease
VTEPDLFVVCKNCSSEVSPYVTECPYCGQRVRKRAPKIEREEETEQGQGRRRRARPTLPRLRPEEIQGIAPDARPYATLGLVALSLLATLALRAGWDLLAHAAVFVPFGAGEYWRYAASPFIHDNLAYQFIALVVVGIFGMLLERRFGPVPVVAVFLLAGAAGCAAAVAVDLAPPFESVIGAYPVIGANGAALGLLAAWLMDDRLAVRRGDDRENDMLGVYVLGAMVLLVPLAVEEASAVAGVAGALAGAALGLALPVFTRR